MAEWVRALLDLVLILMVGAGLVQVGRLIKHLAGLRQGRIDMERFVRDFNATVMRAENGIKGLRQAARESGDDLEKLVEKGTLVRDDLQFIIESADKIAERLSQSASGILKPEAKAAEARPAQAPAETPVTPMAARKPEAKEAVPGSRAEKELLQALRKLS